MAIEVPYDDAATISTTEYSLPADSTTLATITDDGLYVPYLDFNNLDHDDLFEFKVYEKVTAGGSKIPIFTDTISGKMAKLYRGPALILLHGWDMTLKRLGDTDQSIGWSIRRLTGSLTAAFEDSATIGATEYSFPADSTTLATRTEDGLFQLFVDASALADGDHYRFVEKEKAQAAGSQREILGKNMIHDQDGGIVFPPEILTAGWDMTARKIAGTDRAIGWSIRQAA